MRKVLFCFLFFGLISPVIAQVINIRGQVLDGETKEPVPFVNIRLNDYYYGTSTNLDGRFELKLTPGRFKGKDELRITAIGYKTRILKLSRIDTTRYQKIQLFPVSKQLQAVVVKSARAQRKENTLAKTIVMDALDNIPYNRAKNHYLTNAFYRHYCKEDDHYVRLIEAALDVYQHRRDKHFVQIPEQKLAFDVTQLRRSFDFTASAKLEHTHFSLNFLLSNDLTAYEFHNPLRRDLSKYQFAIADTTQLDGDRVLVIDFESREEQSGQRYYEGTLYLEMERLAFLRADVSESVMKKSKLDSTRMKLKKQVFFQRIGNAIYPDRLISDLNAIHFSLDSLSGKVIDQVRHEAHVELMNNAIDPQNKRVINGSEPSQRELREISYDSTFWNSYTVLQATPLEEKIIQDLSAKLALEKQFEAYNKLEEGSQSVIETEQFQAVLQEYSGTPVYVVIWAGWSPPNFYEMISAPALKKLVKKERVQLAMVSLDADDSEWEMNRDLNGFNLPGIRHHRLDFEFGSEITRQFFRSALPAYLLFDANGELYDQSPPLPNAVGVKDYYMELINGDGSQSVENR